jgi:hypothetical protein
MDVIAGRTATRAITTWITCSRELRADRPAFLDESFSPRTVRRMIQSIWICARDESFAANQPHELLVLL